MTDADLYVVIDQSQNAIIRLIHKNAHTCEENENARTGK